MGHVLVGRWVEYAGCDVEQSRRLVGGQFGLADVEPVKCLIG